LRLQFFAQEHYIPVWSNIPNPDDKKLVEIQIAEQDGSGDQLALLMTLKNIEDLELRLSQARTLFEEYHEE
jgi:hypothetical protein